MLAQVQLTNWINSGIQQGGDLAFVLLLVFAFANYGEKVSFTSVYRASWIILASLVYIFQIIITSPMLKTLAVGLNLPLFFTHIILSGFGAALFIYAVIILRQKRQAGDNLLLKGLLFFAALSALFGIVAIFNNILHNVLYLAGTPYLPHTYYNYFLVLANLSKPTILLAALLIYMQSQKTEEDGS
ncbi:MAG: hypothetical protein FH756_17190 [Firmicutes bacterium]|nr:hypothetical protein [Bacillota bacterium]